jgi:putative acetyltransferase
VTSIRAAGASDTAAIAAVTTRAFGRANVAELVTTLGGGPARISLVADVDDAVVGHVLLSRGWIDAERELIETLVLSPLSVDPAHQGRGIGGDLVRAALDRARETGATGVFLEGSRDYYSRLGFELGAARGFVPPSARVPDQAFQVVVLPGWQDWMTGPLVYPEAFWTHDLVGLRGERLQQVRAAGTD